MKRINFSLLLVLLLAACGDAVISDPATVVPVVTPTQELAPPPTSIIAPTLAPNPTPTLDTRLPPEQWQEWPVVPSITGRAIEIYQAGLAMGNNPHAFSKAGDCQNIYQAFMGYFSDPARYNLGTDYQYLQETIDNFAGYFNTDGQAVKGGFNAASVMTPLRANPEVCQPGEGPLECELRITKPSIVFISFEVWWDGRTPETYEKYMRQVIDMVIDHGAVPILATKADNVEGDQSINLTTARLAYEYDLPLWNFWAAVQSLPNHGMDLTRNDGFHISTDGWNVRSFTGIQALDSIWRGLRDTTSANFALVTATAEPTRTSNLLPIPAAGPGLGSSTERVIFGVMARQDGAYEAQGVYLFDPAAQTIALLLGPGFNFQSASPDGKYILVNKDDSLYRTDGAVLTLLTDQFFPSGAQGALWLPDGRIALIVRQEETTFMDLIQANGSVMTTFTADAAPVEIYPSTDGARLTWESGSCDNAGQCTLKGAWLTDLSAGLSQSLNGIPRPQISPTGQSMAYAYVPEANKSNLAFAFFDGKLPRQYPIAGDILADFAWQPGGEWLAVSMAERSDYSGSVTGSYHYLINSQTFASRQLQSVTLLNPSLAWSPEGGTLLLFGTAWVDDTYQIQLWAADAASGQMVEWTDALGLSGSDYLFVSNAAWLVRP